jgi:signal transduction histidine kinase
VHETGARVTHDVKNLLQSLNVLCSVAAAEGGESPQALALVRRQLPAITQRLAATLDKLQRPAPEQDTRVPIGEWWEALARQYRDRGVEFAGAAGPASAEIPRALFDSVADNLLANALAKRAAQPGVRVRAALQGDDEPGLLVCDTGRAVPAEIAASMLRAPVRSEGGLGIGLYQAARQAEAAGYVLRLESNREGEVCFGLRRAAA